MTTISYDDFKKLEIRIGKILFAEKVPETDKLLKLSVDFGVRKISRPKVGGAEGEVEEVEERELRQIVSGISAYFPEPTSLVGRTVAFAANLAPRMIKGLESQGMILAVGGDGEPFSLLEASAEAVPGALVR